MVEVDVRDNGNARTQRLDGAIGLVSLDDEPAVADSRVAAQLRDVAADQPRGIASEAIRQNAIIPLVVVFPWAPATTTDSRSDTSSARSSARVLPGPRPANAVDTYGSP